MEYGPLIYFAAFAALYYYVIYPELYPKYEHTSPKFIGPTAVYVLLVGIVYLLIVYPLLVA
jgi:hypothetical protein